MPLPAIRRDTDIVMTPRTLARASRGQQKTELAVFEHGLARQAQSMMDQIDTAAGDLMARVYHHSLRIGSSCARTSSTTSSTPTASTPSP